MTKPKKSAPKTEAKVKSVKPKAAPKPKVEAVKAEAKEVPIEEPIKEVAPKKQPIRFNTGDVIKHEGRLYQCISVNGHHDAILASYSHLNNRADHSKVMTVSNDPSVEDGFTFSKY